MQIHAKTSIDSAEFKENQKRNLSLLSDLSRFKEISREERISSKNPSKLPVRQRISKVIDNGSFFMELGLFAGGLKEAGYQHYQEETPSGGIITGIGIVHHKPCMIIAHDHAVKAGAYFPITIKKHLRALEVALENNLTCIYLCDSAGAFLPKQHEIFADREGFGRIFYYQSLLNQKGISQFAAVFGHCTAGGAYIPAMADQTVIVEKTGAIFLAGPALVKSALGEVTSWQDLGGWGTHGLKSGLAEYVASSEEEALAYIRQLVLLSDSSQSSDSSFHSREPLYDPEEILGLWSPDIFKNKPPVMEEILLRIVDKSELWAFKPKFGPELFTGFGYIEGRLCGFLANQHGTLTVDSTQKAIHFIQTCERQGNPLVFFQNISGFMVGSRMEQKGLAKLGAQMIYHMSTALVPKLTFILGGSYGAGTYAMAGRAFQPRFLWSWPTGEVGIMGSQHAKNVMGTLGKSLDEKAFKQTLSPFYASSHLWDDGIISPLETRKYLIHSLQSCYQKTTLASAINRT